MGANRKQFLFNQIIAADPTKNIEDIYNGDLEETYHQMVNSGTINPYAALRDSRRMAELGSSDRQRSLALSRVAYDDFSTASFTEQWANFSAWALNTGTGLQISSGRVYAGTTQNGGSCANHSYAVTSTGLLRALFNVKLAGGLPSANVIVGVSSATAGSAPATGATDARGLSFSGATGQIQKWDNGTPTNLGAYNSAKDYTVAVIADGTYLSVIASPTDGSAGEFRARWLQNTVTINNLFVFNSDPRALTGANVGPVGATKSLSTIVPRTGIEGVGRTVHWSQISGNNVKVTLPANYDSRIPMPLAICFHGNGSDENLYSDNVDSNATAVALTLLAAGYIVLTAAYTPGTSTWGAQGSLDAYYAAYKFARDNYAIGPVVIHADSMGGIESLLTIAENRIPGIVAWFGSSPTASLAKNFANPTFTATIRSAYGIAADNSDYASKTLGHDPALMNGSAFRGLPMCFYAATDDTTVPKVDNSDVIASLVQYYAPELQVPLGITGGHGAPGAFPTATIVSFFNKYTRAA